MSADCARCSSSGPTPYRTSTTTTAETATQAAAAPAIQPGVTGRGGRPRSASRGGSVTATRGGPVAASSGGPVVVSVMTTCFSHTKVNAPGRHGRTMGEQPGPAGRPLPGCSPADGSCSPSVRDASVVRPAQPCFDPAEMAQTVAPPALDDEPTA